LTSLGSASPETALLAAPSAGRRLAFAAVVLGLLCALCAPFFIDLIAHDAPLARAGVVDFTHWGPLSTPVDLKGDWRVVYRTPPAAGTVLLVPVPGNLAGERPGGPTLPENGVASYQLTIKGLPAGQYTLYVSQMFNASRVLVNGRVLSSRGTFGFTSAATQDLHRSQDVAIEADGSDLAVQVDLASFHHHDSGLKNSAIFGLSDGMSRWISLDWLRSCLLITSLLLLACYGLVVFLFRPQERPSLYFGITCLLLLPFAAMGGHDDLLTVALPGLGLRNLLTAQYLTSAAAVALALVYVRELFPQETPKWLYWAFQGANGLRLTAYAVVGVMGDTVLLSRLSQWAASLRTLAFVFMLGIVIAACVRRRDGAVVFLVGLGSFVLCLIYTDLVGNAALPRVFGSNLAPVGAMLLLFSQLLILAERWSAAITAAERTNMDLRRLLDVNISISSEIDLGTLLKKIVKVTTAVIHADRSSLFLHDARADELASVVAEGVEGQELRFPAAQGLAGWSFTHGQAVNLPDAYADPRFNRQVDTATGYQTHSVLTVPVTTRDGRRVGVMQALNHQDRSSFGEGEMERMSAFAAQAAIAIENATLFAEVAAERNYNESILRSMSSGVITLDRDARVAKLNMAACTILGIPPEAAGAAEARLLLTGENAWLMDEIEAVSASGKPKTLLDADVRTVRGEVISANLSIVPLITEVEPVGLLILIEDITQGKRLQGAMRRFMTQKVVDQIMGREDELLFGSACQASVLFADIRNFTAHAEGLGARDTVEMLNEIFTELFEAVSASDGVLDKFIGDAVMAVYGAPLSSGRDALNAVESAVAMIGMIGAINERRGARGLPDINLGIAVASGEVIAGTIGSPKRMDYTVIGDSVNLASRLEAITKVYQVGIVICEDTAEAVGTALPLRELDIIRVRGRQRPVRIFQVMPQDAALSPAALEAYARGRAAMAEARWAAAIAAFEAALAAAPGDRASRLMLDRAFILIDHPPPAGWDGVWDSAGGPGVAGQGAEPATFA
jgi:adenylate cyclase